VHALWRKKPSVRVPSSVLVVVGMLALVAASCRSPHQPVSRSESQVEPGWVKPNRLFTEVSYRPVQGEVPVVAGAEFVKDDEICMQCHDIYARSFSHNVHRGQGCESCHGPASKHVETRGKEPGLIFSFKMASSATKSEMCLRCHEQNACSEGARWRVSKHAHCGVSCVDCHRAHYNVQPGTPSTQVALDDSLPMESKIAKFASLSTDLAPATAAANLPSLKGTSQHLGAVSPYICYRCHSQMQDLQAVAHPHQILGPHGFNCTTCHDAHGNILAETRRELCLQCHKGAPTMAWHSSIHADAGVACTDCHNPHPDANVQHFVEINHTNIRREKRLPMSVQEPEACFKCHPKMLALFSLPSHHPVKEGKMVCSDCHDPHGQAEKNLKEATINLVCYKCHADKQGPFAFEHPPVRENCAICHEPHGTVANNLLRQPATFLCLRCHPGHNAGAHPAVNLPTVPLANPVNSPAGTVNGLRAAFYGNCVQCHQTIHGTNRISQRGETFFTR